MSRYSNPYAEIVTYEFGAVEIPGGFAPAIRHCGVLRHWYRTPLSKEAALEEALAQAQAEATHFVGDWEVHIRPLG